MLYRTFLDFMIQKSAKVVTFAILVFITLLFAVFWLAFFSPNDYQQIQAVKIMYIHVPCSWLAMMIYCLVVLFSIFSFVFYNRFFLILAFESLKLGLMFCLLSLVTGAIWGKPIWGSWWVWDARLTSMLFLAFTYLALIALCDAHWFNFNFPKIFFIFAISGGINIPIIKFSTQYWNTLHQPSSFIGPRGVSMEWEFLYPLLLSFLIMIVLYVMLLVIGVARFLIQEKAIQHHKESNKL